MIETHFLENLNTLMESNDLNQLRLSKLVNIPVGTINNWYKRKSIPGPETIESLSELFKIEPYFFFMKPGTQGNAKPVQRHDDFKNLLDEIALKTLNPIQLETYKQAGASEFIRILRTNHETEHTLPVDWFLEINKELNKYTSTSLDLVGKLRAIYAERDAKKAKTS